MRRTVEIDGALLRKERESRAWTQERLSEESSLGVRTVRRLESGQGSLDSLRRVAEVLNLDPDDVVLDTNPEPHSWRPDDSRFDLLVVEFSTDICTEDFVNCFVERVGRIRRHIYQQLGYVVPGVRFRDNLKVESGHYRILIRERSEASGRLHLNRLLAIGGELSAVDGEDCLDPTYQMPAKWIEPPTKTEAEKVGASVFRPVDVMSTHLTQLIRQNAYRLLGIEETAALLDDLHRPRTVQEVLPQRISLTQLRTLLRELLKEQISIRDLALILEVIADGDLHESVEDRMKRVRASLPSDQ